MNGNKISIWIGIIIAVIATRFIEDGNLLFACIAILLAAMMTRTFWEAVKRVKNSFKKTN